ncbi:MAG: hypothetical protein AAGJ73_03290 [Pseudomonadota bacterium]
MKVLGIRFCRVAKRENAEALAKMLGPAGLGIKERDLGALGDAGGFSGAVFPIEANEDNSWIEIWPAGPEMPEMVMLQIIVDDADAWAQNARNNGLDPKGPDDAHGERIYYLEGPGGLPIAFASKVAD